MVWTWWCNDCGTLAKRAGNCQSCGLILDGPISLTSHNAAVAQVSREDGLSVERAHYGAPTDFKGTKIPEEM